MYQSVLMTGLPVTVDPEIMSGIPVFQGTRVPVQTLFDYLLDGCTLAEFLDNFPTVSEEAARKLLVYTARHITNGVAVASISRSTGLRWNAALTLRVDA